MTSVNSMEASFSSKTIQQCNQTDFCNTHQTILPYSCLPPEPTTTTIETTTTMTTTTIAMTTAPPEIWSAGAVAGLTIARVRTERII